MGKFDAAIELLKQKLSDGEKDHYHNTAPPDYCPCEAYKAAVTLLEAADKVDKANALSSMRHSDANEAWFGLDEGWHDIHALLLALPDEPAKQAEPAGQDGRAGGTE